VRRWLRLTLGAGVAGEQGGAERGGAEARERAVMIAAPWAPVMTVARRPRVTTPAGTPS
jgi:hypothetical protein